MIQDDKTQERDAQGRFRGDKGPIKRRADYYAAHRKEIRAKQKEYQIAHRKEAHARHPAWYSMHKKEMQAHNRLYKYGMSQKTFEALLNKQGGVCAICEKADFNGRLPAVDHDHVTGKVRGILCNPCNAALGMIRDDPKIAQSMMNYLNVEIKGGDSVRG